MTALIRFIIITLLSTFSSLTGLDLSMEHPAPDQSEIISAQSKEKCPLQYTWDFDNIPSES